MHILARFGISRVIVAAYILRAIIIFSIIFRSRVMILPTGPSPLVICRKLLRSAMFRVFVSRISIANVGRKMITPIMRRIQLGKASEVTIK